MSFLFGGQKSQTTIPAWVQQPAERNIVNAQNVAALGYTPYYGPDVAAFTPMQEASFQNTADAMTAFGMAAPSNPMAGMPQPQTFAGGVRGYSSAPMFEQAIATLQQRNPAQYAAIMSALAQMRANQGADLTRQVLPVSGGSSGGGGYSVQNSGSPSGGVYQKSNLYSGTGIIGRTLSALSPQKSSTSTTSGTTKTSTSTSKSSTSTRR